MRVVRTLGSAGACLALAAGIAVAQAAPALAAPEQTRPALTASAQAAGEWFVHYQFYRSNADCLVTGRGLLRSLQYKDFLCHEWQPGYWELWVESY